jgi:hypothetical protein
LNAAASRLEVVAARLVWHKKPPDALADTDDFLCRVMNLGSVEDIVTVREFYSRDDFIRALRGAPPGVLSKASWNYWHLVLGLWPPPEVPQRNFK